MNDCECQIVAWSIEWEGTITLADMNFHNTISPRVSIENTDKELLDAFMEIVKIGTIRLCKRKRDTVGNNRCHYIWQVSNFSDVKSLLEEILPYLISKKQQAELVLNLCTSRTSKDRNSPYTEEDWEYCDLIHRLNKRGKKELS